MPGLLPGDQLAWPHQAGRQDPGQDAGDGGQGKNAFMLRAFAFEDLDMQIPVNAEGD